MDGIAFRIGILLRNCNRGTMMLPAMWIIDVISFSEPRGMWEEIIVVVVLVLQSSGRN